MKNMLINIQSVNKIPVKKLKIIIIIIFSIAYFYLNYSLNYILVISYMLVLLLLYNY